MRLYVVRDGIVDVGYVSQNGEQVKDGKYYLLSFDLKSNVGYIGQRSSGDWRLYTSLGATSDMSSRYHHFSSLQECIEQLRNLTPAEVLVVEIAHSFEKGRHVLNPLFDIENPIEHWQQEAVRLFESSGKTLTPGALFKLELLLESYIGEGKAPSACVSLIYERAINTQKQRLVTEPVTIRPEDLFDLPVFNNER